MNFMKTSEKIIKYIKTKKQASAKELTDYLELSERAVFKQLNNLLAKNKITKIGNPPKVFYLLKKEKEEEPIAELDLKTKKVIEENYLIITLAGERKQGVSGFVYWCRKNNLPFEKTAQEYIKTLEKYRAFRRGGFLNGMDKLKATFKKVNLDGVFYLDFYSIERFGKTKAGQLLLYAKQSQNKKLTKELAEDIRPKINKLIKKYKIDAVGFIPPTVKREVQFMKELEKRLQLTVKKISIVKIKTDIIIPQKTLNKLNDRIQNSQKTIIVDEPVKYRNVLLIDDAVGSGATLNETAGQIKRRETAKKVIGFSIAGSFKGFDVISEV